MAGPAPPRVLALIGRVWRWHVIQRVPRVPWVPRDTGGAERARDTDRVIGEGAASSGGDGLHAVIPGL